VASLKAEIADKIIGRLREAIKREGFRCYTYWWREYFNSSVDECSLENGDLEEIERFG